jgi:hypothetical protein
MSTIDQNQPRADDLTARLRMMAQDRETLDVAQFQFIGLEEIQSAYGDRWPANRARIFSIAESFLKRRVDGGDLLISANNGFLVVFGAATGVAAKAAAGAMSHGLNEFFLGEVSESPCPRMTAISAPAPVKELSESLGQAKVVESEPGPLPEAASLPNIDWRYQPVWDVRRETLSIWYTTPYSRKTMERLPGYQFENCSVSAAQYAAVDEASLWISEQAFHDLIPRGRQVLIGSSIHASTLTNLSTRARLMAAIDRLDRQFFRYRVLKIAGVAPGFPRLYLNEIVAMLRAKIPNVVIGAAWDEPDMSGLLASGPVAVGVTLPKSVVGPVAAVAPNVLLKKLTADLQSAHGAHMRFFVEGQIERDLALRLSLAGIDNIASPRVWPASGMPDGMMRWPADRLAA